jgi:NUMOD3 motif
MKRESLDYYVYALFHPADTAFAFPKYIGMGHGVRAMDVPSRKSMSVRRWIAEELGGEEPFFDIIRAGMSQAEAFALEIELIAKHGRTCDGGPLVNIAIGGPFTKGNNHGKGNREHTAESREKIGAALRGRKRVFSADHRAALSAARKGEKHSDTHRAADLANLALAIAAARVANTGKPLSEEHRAAISAANRGKPNLTAESRAALRHPRENKRRPQGTMARHPRSRLTIHMFRRRGLAETAPKHIRRSNGQGGDTIRSQCLPCPWPP